MSAPGRPGVVFDCMTYLQAAASDTGPAAACLRLVDAGAVTLFVSEDVLREVRDVLSRPRVRRKNPRLTDEVLDALMGQLARVAVRLDSVPRQFTYERDPKDEPYVNLALAAGAKYLVTWDNDLLDLMTDALSGPTFGLASPGSSSSRRWRSSVSWPEPPRHRRRDEIRVTGRTSSANGLPRAADAGGRQPRGPAAGPAKGDARSEG